MVMSNITIISAISVSALSSSEVDQPILSCVYIASDLQRHGDQKPLKLTFLDFSSNYGRNNSWQREVGGTWNKPSLTTRQAIEGVTDCHVD